MISVLFSLVAATWASDAYTFPDYFSGDTCVTVSAGDATTHLPEWTKRSFVPAGLVTPKHVTDDIAICGTLYYDSYATHAFRFDTNGSYPIPDAPAWADSVILVDSGSSAFLNETAKQCAYSCKEGECCVPPSGTTSQPFAARSAKPSTPAPSAGCGCASIDPLAVAKMAFSKATKMTSGCTSNGSAGTLFSFKVAADNLIINYCFDTDIHDQLLSLAFQGTGSSSNTAITLSFANWDAELPAESTFSIPSSCVCKKN